LEEDTDQIKGVVAIDGKRPCAVSEVGTAIHLINAFQARHLMVPCLSVNKELMFFYWKMLLLS
jgi:hypothetical protein